MFTCATTFIRNSRFTTVKCVDKTSRDFSKIEVYHIFSTIVAIGFRLLFISGKSPVTGSLQRCPPVPPVFNVSV